MKALLFIIGGAAAAFINVIIGYFVIVWLLLFFDVASSWVTIPLMLLGWVAVIMGGVTGYKFWAANEATAREEGRGRV
jgi:hypothetical protein